MAGDIDVKREIILEADGETLQKMRKEGHARGFTVYCDEAERTGGENTAPPPLALSRALIGVLNADTAFPVWENDEGPY